MRPPRAAAAVQQEMLLSGRGAVVHRDRQPVVEVQHRGELDGVRLDGGDGKIKRRGKTLGAGGATLAAALIVLRATGGGLAIGGRFCASCARDTGTSMFGAGHFTGLTVIGVQGGRSGVRDAGAAVCGVRGGVHRR